MKKRVENIKKQKIDVKYLDVPNICFSLTDKDDKREKWLKKQNGWV